jgi:RHS repeat-associated protein
MVPRENGMHSVPSVAVLGFVAFLAAVASAQDAQRPTPGGEVASPPGDTFFSVSPCRVFDTRVGGQPLVSDVSSIFAVAGHCGIPASANAVAGNVTAVDPSGAGHLTAFPGDGTLPLVSTLNFGAGQSRANNAVLSLAADGSGTLALRPFIVGGGHVDVVLDVSGYFEPSSPSLATITPRGVLAGSPGLTLTAEGSNFSSAAVIRFDGFDLATEFVRSNQLTAAVSAARLGTAGVVPVQVVNPGGYTTAAVFFTIDTPLALAALVPSGVAAGSPDFSLTMSGAGFQPGAVARLGGTDLATTFTGSGMLNATVPAALAARPGTIAVTVKNPGGATSAPLDFRVKSLSLTGINPSSGPVGTAVTLTGDGLDLPPAVLFAKQGGGTLLATLLASSATSLRVSVPTGAASGPVILASGGISLTGPVFTVSTSRTFDLQGGPASAVLFPGATANYGIGATSADGFAGLVVLQVNGLPSGITFKLDPPQISAGQTANLTLSAPAGQALGARPFSVTGTAASEGQTLSRTVGLSVDVRPVSTSFIGRVVAAEAFEHPLSGVTVRFFGESQEGTPNGCPLSPIRTDAGGNFAFVDLPAACTGPQLVGFDGITESGELYTPVNLLFDLQAGFVNQPPVLVHLIPINEAETVLVRQNWGSDQIFTFRTIPGLKLQVYAGTIFSKPDGSTPDPFLLTGLRVPIDRLPDQMNLPVGQIMPFLVSLQPEGSRSSQAVAVDYPNTAGGQPGTAVSLLTLDPRVGAMVLYGTGTISANGLSVVADANPATPGKRYGISHFDWHGPQTPNPPFTARAPLGGEGCAVLKGDCAAAGGCAHPPKGAHSVEYATGAEAMEALEAAITGIPLPVKLVRIYRSDLAGFSGPFGLGTSHSLNYTMLAGRSLDQVVINLSLPNGRVLAYVRQPDGTYRATGTPFARGSRLRWIEAEARYRLEAIDGAAFFFTPTQNSTRSSLSAIADRHGNQIQLVHGLGTGNVQILERILAANGERIVLQYDSQNRIRSVTDAAGRSTLYGYDAAGRLTSVIDPSGGVTSYLYDDQNRLLRVVDPRGITAVTKEYDAAGKVLREIFPDTGEARYAYLTANPADPASPVLETRVTDPLGHTTTYRFTVTGELTDVADALGQRVSFTIDPVSGRYKEREGVAGCPVCGASGAGHQSYEYDDQGRLTKLTDALGSSTTFTYPAIGEVPATITDALGRTMTIAQNAAGDVTGLTDPAGKVWLASYDAAGRLVAITDPNQHTTTFTYGVVGRPETMTDPLGRTTRFVFDGAGRLASRRAPDGTTAYLSYDALDRITSAEDSLGRVTRFAYDAVGNLLALTDPKGSSTSYEYDAAGRLTREIAPDGAARAFVHDKGGNLASRTDRNGHAASFTHDALDRLVDVRYQDGTNVHFEWDAAGHLLAADDAAGGRVERAYDVMGRLISEISPNGSLHYDYDLLGRRTARMGPDGVTVYTYTAQGQVESITSGAMGVRFTYDDAGRMTSALPPNNVTATYSHDAADQVTRIDYTGPGGLSEFRAYSYDLNGRVSSVSGNSLSPPLPSPQTTTFDNRNRVVAMNARPFQYDAEGRLLGDGLRQYAWDDRGLLAEVLGNAGTTTYKYDALRRRSEKTDKGTTTRFLDDGVDVVRREVEGEVSDYLRGPTLDETWSAQSQGTVRSYLRDRLNSTIALIGDTRRFFLYDEYGSSQGGEPSVFGFTGREEDEDRLIYFRSRYYDPATGRFISEDPVGLVGSRYEYALNNPTTHVDPLGLEVTSDEDIWNIYRQARPSPTIEELHNIGREAVWALGKEFIAPSAGCLAGVLAALVLEQPEAVAELCKHGAHLAEFVVFLWDAHGLCHFFPERPGR